MKKWMCSLLFLALLLGAVACGKADDSDKVPSQAEETTEEMTAETAAESETVKAEEPESNIAPESKNYKEGVIEASELMIKNGVAFWGYGEQLCSALLDDAGNLYDFISEGSLSAEIYCTAIDGNVMYLSTDIGIVRLPLENEGQSGGTLLDDHDMDGYPFQIYDGIIYFTYGYSLYAVPEEGGECKTMDSDVDEFQVTTEGIYCLNRDGALTYVSLDGKERRTLSELGVDGDICIYQNRAYITTGDDKDYVYVYELDTGEEEKLHFEQDLSPYYPVWVTADGIYYESDDFDAFYYDFASQTESPCNVPNDLPDYISGCLVDKVLYYVDSEYVCWMHLDSGESFQYTKDELLGSLSPTDSSSETTTPADSAGDYNIAENIDVFSSEGQARLESNYFTLYLPADGDWGYEVLSNTMVRIYYRPAYEAGYGGNLVTIAAFDWGDNSYEDYPAYSIAGLSESKKYIAIFPTDVQYDSDQADGYQQMSEYVRRIDNSEEYAANNPFSCR